MLKDYFYHATTRKVVAVFGSLFNNISIVRKDSAGNILNIVKVPLAYGPKQKFLARIDESPSITDDTQVAIKLPRMSFEITGLTLDAGSKLSRFNQTVNHTTGTVLDSFVPYMLNFQVSILAKNQEDALQVLEQVMPTFQPEYNVSVKYTPTATADMPITLEGVTMSDDYEGDYLTRRTIIYTLDFSVKVRYYGPESTADGIIRSAEVNFWDGQEGDQSTFLEQEKLSVDPIDTTFDVWTGADMPTVKEIITIIPE